MHSSRMRTGRTLTVFQLETPPEKLESTHPLKNWRTPRKIGDHPPRKIGDHPPGPDHPPCGETHACKNITLAKTSFRPVKMTAVLRLWSRQSSKRGVRGYLSFSLKQVIIIRMFVCARQGPGAVVVGFHVVRVRLPGGRGSRAARWMFGLIPRCSFGLLKFAVLRAVDTD